MPRFAHGGLGLNTVPGRVEASTVRERHELLKPYDPLTHPLSSNRCPSRGPWQEAVDEARSKGDRRCEVRICCWRV